jgi:hypothetical protein
MRQVCISRTASLLSHGTSPSSTRKQLQPIEITTEPASGLIYTESPLCNDPSSKVLHWQQEPNLSESEHIAFAVHGYVRVMHHGIDCEAVSNAS